MRRNVASSCLCPGATKEHRFIPDAEFGYRRPACQSHSNPKILNGFTKKFTRETSGTHQHGKHDKKPIRFLRMYWLVNTPTRQTQQKAYRASLCTREDSDKDRLLFWCVWCVAVFSHGRKFSPTLAWGI
jgi:hypothetical protein